MMQWIRRDTHRFSEDPPSFFYWERTFQDQKNVEICTQELGRYFVLPHCIEHRLLSLLLETRISKKEWSFRNQHIQQYKNCLLDFRTCIRTKRHRYLRFMDTRMCLHWILEPSSRIQMNALTCTSCGEYIRSCQEDIPEQIRCHCVVV